MPLCRVLAPDLGLDGEQLADPLQRFHGERRGGVGINLEELAPGMGKAGDLAESGLPSKRVGGVEPLEAGIAISMQEAATSFEQPPGMLGLAVGRVEVAHGRRGGRTPRSFVPNECP